MRGMRLLCLASLMLLLGACATSSGKIVEETPEPQPTEEPPVGVQETPSWTVYDASVLPDQAVPPFYADNIKGLKAETAVVDDPEIPGNKVLSIVSPPGEDNKLCWAMDWDLPNKAATVVFRAKLQGEAVDAIAFDIEFRCGMYRDRLVAYGDGTIKLDKAGVSATIDATAWHVVRITLLQKDEGLAIDVYIDEDPTPLLSGVSTTGHSDKKFRFGDGSGNDYCSSLYDWVIWTTTGAFPPGTGLPGGLTGI
ncbi:hypothetical protein [Spirochaeta thermophila]|uniref:Lipoprotein n=1 Tax=Winmispira thermophila (strain ATCC 49972 / DSM 6192 / RI 19.B1) TaxID=665571 RepID=E0RPR7_WINT6|nr:hypothetical protein [Spirochaeta thermophila]ADN01381.1 hypothetical protein STHERM_c04090 [Spirochaeta thermophila DSM 6192]